MQRSKGVDRTLIEWENLFSEKVRTLASGDDPAHDFAHFNRVVVTSKRIAEAEGANLWVVVPAAWFHDWVNVPKNDPRRSQASKLSADAALSFLSHQGYPSEYAEGIRHAIEAHSYSAGIEARTLEAQVVQDADRLDGLGAIGVARVFSVGGLLQRRIYHPEDPFGRSGRNYNDLENTVDHFFVKLFRTAESLRTRSGREEGIRRVEFMQTYLRELAFELGKEF